MRKKDDKLQLLKLLSLSNVPAIIFKNHWENQIKGTGGAPGKGFSNIFALETAEECEKQKTNATASTDYHDQEDKRNFCNLQEM